MAWIIAKYFLTAAVVVLVSEIAQRSDRFGDFVAVVSMVTVLALIRKFQWKNPMRSKCTPLTFNSTATATADG